MREKMNKGQAALEFMLSYGWAILTVMAVLGAIVYIVPNSGSITQTKCSFPPQMQCSGATLNNENLTISLRNSAGISINSLDIDTISPKLTNCTLSKTSLKADEQFFVYCRNNGTMNITADTKFILLATYLKSRGSYNQTLKGEVYAKYRR